MNRSTRLRVAMMGFITILAVLCMFEAVAILVKGVVALALVVMVALCTYYNNDFSGEACKGTAVTRYLKEIKDENYIGEDFTKRGTDNE